MNSKEEEWHATDELGTKVQLLKQEKLKRIKYGMSTKKKKDNNSYQQKVERWEIVQVMY